MGALIRRLALLITLPFAVAAAFPATAETPPDLWLVSSQAAADAIRDPETAAIVLGNAMELARERDAQGMRPQLTQLQLMLSYVAMDKFELYKSLYGNANFRFDVSKFDPGLKAYSAILGNLREYYYGRWQRPEPSDKNSDLKMEALKYGAMHYAAMEVAVRKKVAAEDVIGLAGSLAWQGRVSSRRGNVKEAVAAYQESLQLLERSRQRRDVVNTVDLDFATSAAAWAQGQGRHLTLNMDEIGEAFVQTEAEYIVPIFGLQDTLAAANQAMDNKDTAEAQTFIDLATGFETQIEKTHRYLHQKWQCQYAVAALHDSLGRRQEALARFEKTFRSDGGRSRSYFDAANIEYAKMLQVVGFSKGYGSSDFSWRFDAYVQFLRTGGRSEEIPKIEALVKSLRQGGETPSGPNSAWPEVLNCAGAM